MLSPGSYHLSVPKDLTANLEFRVALYKRATNPDVQRGLVEICRNDFLFWVNTSVYQFNPLKKGDEIGPFITWDNQDPDAQVLLDCIDRDKNVVIEKSREMGGTYLCILILIWLCLFHRNKKVLIISRSVEAVDRPGDPDSIFWKIEHILDHLPDWMKGEIEQKKMQFEFHRTESVMTGTASTGKAGVGGRASVIFLDEFSQVVEDKEVRQRTASTADCRIFNGTHLGTDTEFFDLTQQPEIVKLQMHWTAHPDKRKGLYEFDAERPGIPRILDTSYRFPDDYPFVLDGSPTGGPYPGRRSPWYDKKSKDIGSSHGVAMDLDINPTGSVSQVFDPLRIARLIQAYACEPIWRGDLDYDKNRAEPNELVPNGHSGRLMLWFNLRPDGTPPLARYVVAFDNATGAAGSHSTPTCACILNVETGEKVGEYADARITPEECAPFAVALCKFFKNPDGGTAMLGWEANGPGIVFGNRVVEWGYRTIYYQDPNETKTVGGGFRGTKPLAARAGWYPNASSKDLLIRTYQSALDTGKFLNRSRLALTSCLAFRWDSRGRVEHPNQVSKNDPSGAGINHGDRVIADALACLMSKGMARILERRKTEEIPYGSLLWRRQQAKRRQLDEEPSIKSEF